MPERIFALEVTMTADDIATLLQPRFAFGDAHMFELQMMGLEERALAAKNLVLYSFHRVVFIIAFLIFFVRAQALLPFSSNYPT